MAITSLDTLPVELLMHIAGYVAAPLFELRSNRHKIMASYMVARRFLRSRTPSTPLTYSLVCRTTHNTLNPCLCQSVARWKDLSMPESHVPIGELVYHGELGLKVIDKLIDARPGRQFWIRPTRNRRIN